MCISLGSGVKAYYRSCFPGVKCFIILLRWTVLLIRPSSASKRTAGCQCSVCVHLIFFGGSELRDIQHSRTLEEGHHRLKSQKWTTNILIIGYIPTYLSKMYNCLNFMLS